MIFITCDYILDNAARETIKREVERQTGERCIVLSGGQFTVQSIPVKTDKKQEPCHRQDQ